MLLTTSRSANSTVKTFEEKRPAYGSGHGQLAWKALTDKYNGHTKEAKRAYHEKQSTRRWSPARIRTTYFSFRMNAVTSSRKWDTQYTTRGTRTSFSKPFRPSTRGYEPPDTRGGTFGWTTFGIWYTLCTWTTVRALSALRRSQAAAMPCRWWATHQ